MKWAYAVKYKIKTAGLLAGILLIILVCNFFNRNSFTTLNTSMSSVVNDRLKPASYIYNISSNLYHKQTLQHERANHDAKAYHMLMQQYNDAIAVLVNQYEATVLTKEERAQWRLFRENLATYNAMENENAPAQQMDSYHALCIQNLDNLNKIQVGVGSDLQKNSASIVNSTMMLSSLEISLLIVLGIFTLILLSTSDNTIFRQQQNQALN